MEIKIIRKLDPLGRIVIPKDIRKTLELSTGDRLEIGVAGDAVTVKKLVMREAEKNA